MGTIHRRARGALGLLAAAMVPSTAAFVLALVAIAITLSACAAGSAASAPDGPVAPDDRLNMGAPRNAEQVVTGLRYYPACGNETLEVDGITWFPYTPANAAELPTSDPAPEPQNASDAAARGAGAPKGAADAGLAIASAAWNAVAGASAADAAPAESVSVDSMSSVSTPAVAAPEPGQDEGVLTIYGDGLAHWTSNLGDLDTWLTSIPLEYAWAC